MKTVITTIAATLATVFALLAAVVFYEMNHLPATYSCTKLTP
jgi:hypothetical protein